MPPHFSGAINDMVMLGNVKRFRALGRPEGRVVTSSVAAGTAAGADLAHVKAFEAGTLDAVDLRNEPSEEAISSGMRTVRRCPRS
jgi:hypothetical protein